MPRLADLLDLIASTREIIRPLPRNVPVAERLKAFPQKGIPLRRRAAVYWDAHQIPFIDAQTDEDAALLLGMVHAHLRRAQLELYRRAVAGRLAEVVGPPAVSLDWSLRLLDLGRAVPQMERELGEDTRLWLTRFAQGINFYSARTPVPYELRVLPGKTEPWTVADVLRVSRMAAADVSWFSFLSYFKLRTEKAFSEFWERVRSVRFLSAAGRGLGGSADRLSALLGTVSRMGSNSLVIGPRLSRSGSALIASDPHLGVSLPNVWLIAGYRCPSYHVVGLMLPGLPFVALGRNPQIAWGGTNLHAQSSDLFDLSELAEGDPKIHCEKQTVRVRFWRDRSVTLRNTPWGPLVSDTPVFPDPPSGEKIALRWVGHEPSSEMAAMLLANRARSTQEFAAAFKEYAVCGQNFLVADRRGTIGHIIAAKIPRREIKQSRPFVLNTNAHGSEWNGFWTSADFPVRLDPEAGFFVSANEKPPEGFPQVGEMFPPTDRADRLADLVRAGVPWDGFQLAEIQRDTYSRSSVYLRDLVLQKLQGVQDSTWKICLQELADWDGTYRRDSRGAVVFQNLLWHYINEVYRERYGKRLTHFLLGSELSRLFAIEDLTSGSSSHQKGLEVAVHRTAKAWKRPRRWGEVHRLRLGHFFQVIPAWGRRFRFHDVPAEGSTETVQKTAHTVTPRRHAVHYGSQARHISDLADPDANYFLLLGGQDGWLGSDTFDDQVTRWDRSELIQVPLQVETVQARFPAKMVLEP